MNTWTKHLLLISLFTLTFIPIYAQKLIPLTPKDKQAFLDAHNYYRKQVNEKPLQWSPKLAQYAQHWAIILAKTQKFQHSPNQTYGENIYQSTFKPTAKDVVDSWASEEKYYHGEKISLNNYWIFGHYTQIIWEETTSVGCAISQDANGIYYVVCEYYPPGNIIGKKPVPSKQ